MANVDPSIDAVQAAKRLSEAVQGLSFGSPVSHVYNPLVYAWDSHRLYLERYASRPKRLVFMGMNPGPWGMAQTGIPFGEISAVRDWIGIDVPVEKPEPEHPKRPVEGFACTRSEVSGRRLWGFFKDVFGSPQAFFRDHFVANYCPLIFMADSGRNITPDKLSAAEQAPLTAACDAHLRELMKLLQPEWLIGVGAYAEARAREALEGEPFPRHFGRILHPSPASPAANRGWAEQAEAQLKAMGVFAGCSSFSGSR